MTRFLSGFLFLFFSSNVVWAQDTLFARKALDTLCSTSFAGRGYVLQGQENAAKWIFEQFQKGKPSQLGIQEFQDQVVVFPKEPHLIINGVEMEVGRAWLPHADAPSISGRFRPVVLDSAFFAQPTKLPRKAILVTNPTFKSKAEQFALQKKLPLLIQGKNPPLWTVDQSLASTPHLYWQNSTSMVPEKIQLSIDSKLKQHTFQNVWAILPGKSDSIILISAHYDHLGQCGPVIFPGANDNASGTAMMLDLYHHLSKENRNFTVVFCAFSGEEAGLLGSSYFVKNPPLSLKKLKFVVNLDLMATGEDGITVVNAVQEKELYQRMLEINKGIGLPQIGSRSNAPNSDHYPFTQAGYRAIFLYAQGPSVKAYHHPDDVPQKVLWKGYHQIFKLIHTLIQ